MNHRSWVNTPASAQLERVREIIMGRQLGVIEQRLDQLEKRVAFAGVPTVGSTDARIEEVEVRLEAQRAGFQQQIDQLRREAEAEKMQRNDEVRRLAEWVRQSLQERAQVSTDPESWQNLEQRLQARLSQQQQALEHHLLEREKQYLQRLHFEWQNMQSTMSTATLSPQAQQQIAAAAQALSAAAATLSQFARSLNPSA
jgi:hypothetical protein